LPQAKTSHIHERRQRAITPAALSSTGNRVIDDTSRPRRVPVSGVNQLLEKRLRSIHPRFRDLARIRVAGPFQRPINT
jgi:hypothetical protein